MQENEALERKLQITCKKYRGQMGSHLFQKNTSSENSVKGSWVLLHHQENTHPDHPSNGKASQAVQPEFSQTWTKHQQLLCSLSNSSPHPYQQTPSPPSLWRSSRPAGHLTSCRRWELGFLCQAQAGHGPGQPPGWRS